MAGLQAVGGIAPPRVPTINDRIIDARNSLRDLLIKQQALSYRVGVGGQGEVAQNSQQPPSSELTDHVVSEISSLLGKLHENQAELERIA